jgi:broad specificity phosphatase PhoE
VDERWTELDYGDFDNRPPGDLAPELWQQWRSDPSYRPGGGESLVELGERVRAACDDLAPRAADGNVVVVTHVSPIKAGVAWALGTGDEVAWRMFVTLASITRIGVTERGAVLRSFNEVGHLATSA